MGWPDDHTKVGYDGYSDALVPETTRIKMTGNGVVSPVAQWLGHRLVEVDGFNL